MQEAKVMFQERFEKCEGECAACNWGKSMFQAKGTAHAKSLRLEGNIKEGRGR